MRTKVKQFILLFLLWNILVFAMGIFIAWDINIGNWEWSSRYALVMCGPIIGCVIALMPVEIFKDE